MACFLRNEEDEGLEGDRYYWKWTSGVKKNSREFELHGKTWRCSASLRSTGLNIRIRNLNEGGPEDHLFDIQAGIVGDGRKEMTTVKEVVPLNTYYQLMTRSEFDFILQINRDVHLFVDIRKSENVQRIKTSKQKIEMDYTEMLLSGIYSDVILEVRGQQFNCHSCIMGARSRVLAAMFEHDMKEKSTGVVTIKDAEPAVFRDFLIYLYSGNDDHLNPDSAAELYKLADKYSVDDLKSVCRDEMKENIDKDNFFEIFILSHLYSDSELTEMAIQLFLREKDDIVNDEYWNTFLSEYPGESEILLKSLDDE